MTRTEAINILCTELKYTTVDADYAHDTANGEVELVPGQDIADALRMAIAALGAQEILRWIPVTERLPEKEGRYLCVVRIGRKSGAVYVQVMNGDSYGFRLEHIYNDDVTHWMPLPEPPKGE